MYTMKEACKLTGLPYETLKFYCNQGLVPNVKRSESNYRLFDERDIKWINSLCCLKSCGMSIGETKEYLALERILSSGCGRSRALSTTSTESRTSTTRFSPEKPSISVT